MFFFVFWVSFAFCSKDMFVFFCCFCFVFVFLEVFSLGNAQRVVFFWVSFSPRFGHGGENGGFLGDLTFGLSMIGLVEMFGHYLEATKTSLAMNEENRFIAIYIITQRDLQVR